jgi:hypothetical protein
MRAPRDEAKALNDSLKRGETKRIRENNSFRAAGKHLGILSKHEGFGPGRATS